MIKEMEFSQIEECVWVIKDSFRGVEKELGIEGSRGMTSEQITVETLKNRDCSECDMFVYEYNQQIIGFFSLFSRNASSCDMEDLAVLPEFRHKGYDKEMISFALDRVKESGRDRMNIMIIDENEKLKNWYIDLGFRVKTTEKLPFLSFAISCMEIKI